MWKSEEHRERALFALVSHAHEVSKKSIAHWTMREIASMEIANEHSINAGYSNWKDAYTQLKKKIVDTSHQNS